MLGDTHLLNKNFKPKLLGPFGQDLYAVTLFVNFTNERVFFENSNNLQIASNKFHVQQSQAQIAIHLTFT